jgi:hypothetical protein
LQIGLPNSMVFVFPAMGPIPAHKVQYLLVTLGRLKRFFFNSASTPSVQPLGLISTFAPIGMLDLGWKSALTPSVKRAWDLVKFPYFVDTTERGDTGWKQAQIEDENRMTLGVTLLVKILFEFEILVLCVMMSTYFWNKLFFVFIILLGEYSFLIFLIT